MNQTPRASFDPSLRTIMKIVCVIAGVVFVMKIMKLCLLFFLGFLLAVSLDPLVLRMQKWGVSRRLAIALIALSMLTVIGLIGVVLVPSIFSQVTILISAFPSIKAAVLKHLPAGGPVQTTLGQILSSPKIPDASVLMEKAETVLTSVFAAIAEFLLTLLFSVYLLIDGRRALKWVTDFFSLPVRLKLEATSVGCAPVIHGYVSGQLIAGLSSCIFSFVMLHAFHVPGAITLAVLAGILDVIPIIGFFLAVTPALFLALTVSPSVAASVLLLFLLYHGFENYLLIPYIYRNSMKLSPLVVLVGLLVAGSLAGVLGAIAILPLIASYPVIEKIWLVKFLGRRVIQKHSEILESAALPDQVKVWNERPLASYRAPNALSGHQMYRTFGRKILIVEDDPDIRSMLQEILETEGYGTIVAANGREGLDLLRRHGRVGLILLDMMMPVMNGREFLDAVKAMAGFEKIPVVFLSATADPSNTHGAAGVLRKPSGVDSVLDVVDQHYTSEL